jgi:hypothetical protein
MDCPLAVDPIITPSLLILMAFKALEANPFWELEETLESLA